MTCVDLRPFGFQCDVEAHGAVVDSWSGGSRLVFLIGENHKDREMKRLNLQDACSLCNLGILACVGVEEAMEDAIRWDREKIDRWSRELFDYHKTDDGVIAYLSQHQPSWYGLFEFGKTLKLLRPSLDVRCVEDPGLREQMKPIASSYELWGLGAAPHPSPEHPKMGDHPHNFLREEAMIANLFKLWEEPREAGAALLNTGLDHCRRLAERLQAQGINYIYLLNPTNPIAF